ncbi:expressed unknown protein [Seminavis robusta]|uniref:Uncharacterized protein n=1 Tax=Seminavis robusta TaxID=568900 RepID=A0A9N8EZB3_9STRA|nr:expressed unknown protein [Seminavis robusta]|eukprot:Sro2295_g322350.1 n/a (304) ;mRNA; f:10103-11014
MPLRRSRSSPSLLQELSGLKELSFRRIKTSTPISPAFQSTELTAEDLENFVCQVLSQHVDDADTPNFRNLQYHVKQLAKHADQREGKLCHKCRGCPFCSATFLGEIVLSLKTVIESTPSLSAKMTAQVHSMIGLLRQQYGDLKAAIRSFLRVLWILSSLTLDPLAVQVEENEESVEERETLVWKMGITRHRLGMAYGKSGDFVDAITLLQTAVKDYETYEANNGTPSLTRPQKGIVEQAKADLDSFTEARLLEQALKEQKLATIRRRRAYIRRSSTSLLGNNNNNTAATTVTRNPVMRRSSAA